MAVEILESCMVTPSEATPKHGVWLSNLDLLVARGHTPTVYIYRPSSGHASFSPDVLKAALSRALVPFYPLAGRLAQDDAGRPEISCSGEGVLFVTARADSTLDVLGDFAPSEELRRTLVPSADASGVAGILAMFQVTFFKCGGVCLGAAIHHTAADGLAALDFVNAWAAITRGDVGVPAASPCLDRTLLRARSPPSVLFDHAEYSRRGGGETKPRVPFGSAILPMSKNQIDALKGGAGEGKRLSTFKAVVAHVWRCACKARGLAATEDTRLYMTADARTRVHPPLPRGYFGNATFRASAATKVGEVASGPLDAVAEKVTGATARLDDEYVRSLLDGAGGGRVGAAQGGVGHAGDRPVGDKLAGAADLRRGLRLGAAGVHGQGLPPVQRPRVPRAWPRRRRPAGRGGGHGAREPGQVQVFYQELMH
uniref:Anthranilate N-benzoyltransferase protein 1 n=1 Tax=Aegilops tauschii subsp. strangulata TaxID=200361 RepID=A0A453QZH5_AEGTS